MKVFAHRGASAYAPQNTVPSFKKALKMGVEGIELDVQLTSDGIPVVIHDFYLDKLTNRRGLIHQKSWREVREADAGLWFSAEFAGTPIPALEEVLALVPPEVILNIEIKSLSFLKEETPRIVLDLLAQGGKRELIISSFNHNILKEVQDMSPHTPLGILSGCDMIDCHSYIEHSGLKPYSLHPEASCLSPGYVQQSHDRGWKVMCYTINTSEHVALAADMGVDGIFTDYPDILPGPKKFHHGNTQ